MNMSSKMNMLSNLCAHAFKVLTQITKGVAVFVQHNSSVWKTQITKGVALYVGTTAVHEQHNSLRV